MSDVTSMRQRPFEDLSDSGVLWAINRVLFHPRGYALTLVFNEEGAATGWYIQGLGKEVWSFDERTDDERFAAFEETLQFNVEVCTREQPHDGPCNGWPCAYVRNLLGLG